jgi:phage terminase large subunit-like protein
LYDVLTSTHKRLFLNCCRQSGKSTVAALLSVLEAVAIARTKVLIMAPSLRQSQMLFKTASDFLQRVGQRFVNKHTIHYGRMR